MLDAYSQEEPTLSKCEHETVFSYTFDLIHPHAGDSTACSRSPLYRICSLMRKMNAQAYVREELVSNSEIDDEVRAAGLRTGGQVSAKAVRFTFFRE